MKFSVMKSKKKAKKTITHYIFCMSAPNVVVACRHSHNRFFRYFSVSLHSSGQTVVVTPSYPTLLYSQQMPLLQSKRRWL